MTDVALIENGVVAQVWRDAEIQSEPPAEGEPWTGLNPADFAGELVMFEASEHVVCGMAWDGDELTVPEPSAPSESQLLDYANAKYAAQMAGGVYVSGVWVNTTGGGRVEMLGAVSLAQLAPEHVFDWVNGSQTIQLSSAQVIALGLAVGQWVQDNYTVLGVVRADIASEDITSYAEIDAANWPSNT